MCLCVCMCVSMCSVCRHIAYILYRYKHCMCTCHVCVFVCEAEKPIGYRAPYVGVMLSFRYCNLSVITAQMIM